MTGPKVGLIGLGRMGLPMSRRLLSAGFDLTVHNRSQGKVQDIAREGAHPAVSTAEITQATDIFLTCLPDIATSEEIFLGKDGIIANARPGQLLVGVHSQAAGEAMLLGAKSGADPELVFETVNSGWGQSFMLNRNAPVMIDRDFDGVRTKIRVFLNDLGLVQELAQELGVQTPAADLARQMLQEDDNPGLGDLDGAANVLTLEDKAGFKIERLSP